MENSNPIKVYAQDRGIFPTLMGEIIADYGICIPENIQVALAARTDFLVDLVIVHIEVTGYIMPVGFYEPIDESGNLCNVLVERESIARSLLFVIDPQRAIRPDWKEETL